MLHMQEKLLVMAWTRNKAGDDVSALGLFSVKERSCAIQLTASITGVFYKIQDIVAPAMVIVTNHDSRMEE